jgi:tetratricopeptide (TPR) repeat protein
MAGNIFINYRRDESSHVAGRLHDSLAPKFGRNKLFMDVDNIPVGRDFEDYLKSQVAACDAMLAIIGPNWLAAKDETGQRRLDNPNDFIVIEIGVALARNIPVVPVLIDGARMPKASELPDSLKPLARRQAIEVRHTNFNSDADTLIKRLREVLGPESRWRGRATKAVAAMAVLFLVTWGGYRFVHPMRIYLEESFRAVQQLVEEAKAERERQARVEEKRKADEAEQQRLSALKAEQAAEEKRKADEAEQQRLTALNEQERQARVSEANRIAEAEQQRIEGEAAGRAGDYDKALASFNEAIRLNHNDAVAYFDRGQTYSFKGDSPQAIADYTEAIRLDPKYADAFFKRARDYFEKGDYDRAITDSTEAIRLNPKYAAAFNNRGFFYMKKGDYHRALADYAEALRLDPSDALALCNRGVAKLKINDSSGNADIAKARELKSAACQ